MMKVYHIITSFDLGGAERVAFNIAESSDRDFEYHLVEVVRGNSEFTQGILKELSQHHVTYHRVPFSCSNKMAIVLFPFWFLFLAICQRPQIIHSHTEIPDLSVFIFYRLFGWIFPSIRYVRTIHNTVLWSNWEYIGRKVEQFFNRKNANVAISVSTQKCYEEVYGVHVPIVYNGVKEVVQKTYEGLVKDKINILFAGRLEPQKGIDMLCKVIWTLSADQRFAFHIVGNGSQHSFVEKLRDIHNIFLYDRIYGLSSFLGSFDYLFMPSLHEGLALTPIEAAMAHVPTIINPVPGLKDTLPEDWPLSVHEYTTEAFVDIFNKLDQIDRNELGERAYRFVRKHFSIKEMQQGYARIYKERLEQTDKIY